MSEAGAEHRLRVAVIGHGWWGHVHLDAYRRHPAAELIGVCGRRRERVEPVASQYGIQAYTDVARMLEEGRPDLVSVVVSDEAHLVPTMQVLEAGIACLAEKPIALLREEARALLAAARRHNVRFGINFNHRFSTPFLMARRVVDEGRLGVPAHFLWRFTGGHFPERLGRLQHLLYMQSHGFDMLRYFGGPIHDVGCICASPRGDDRGTTASVSITFASGAVGTLIASVDGSYADAGVHQFEALGLGGRLRVSDLVRRFEWSPREAREGITVWEPGIFEDEARSFAATTDRLIDATLRAQLAGEPVPVAAEDGYAALLAGLAAVESAESGRRVALTAVDAL